MSVRDGTRLSVEVRRDVGKDRPEALDAFSRTSGRAPDEKGPQRGRGRALQSLRHPFREFSATFRASRW